MTVAVAVKVFDGVVLAADSATTFQLQGGSAQVYNGANKVFHLHRDRPIGAMTWGLANVGSASIATLAKDLRRRLMGKDDLYPDWELDDAYTVRQVAERLIEMVWGEVYQPEWEGKADCPFAGFLVVGYSGGEKQAEGWLVELDSADKANPPAPVQSFDPTQSGWIAFGQPQATGRLFNGVDPFVASDVLAAVAPAQKPAVKQLLLDAQQMPAQAAMPFVDAIKLARFMVDVTAGYNRFLLGPDTVGGPVEVAGISRHEGFKWIERKHYYDGNLNPGSPHQHDQ